jgi:hypothetical protein
MYSLPTPIQMRRREINVGSFPTSAPAPVQLTRHNEYVYMRTQQLRYGPGQATNTVVATASLVVGGLLLLWSSYIHFHLWQKLGYRHIPTIGWLFLLQSIAGLLLGVLVIVVRRVWAAVLGLGFALSTMAGLLISVEHGLFGFKDSLSAPFAHQALAVEIASIVAFVIGVTLCLLGTASKA